MRYFIKNQHLTGISFTLNSATGRVFLLRLIASNLESSSSSSTGPPLPEGANSSWNCRTHSPPPKLYPINSLQPTVLLMDCPSSWHSRSSGHFLLCYKVRPSVVDMFESDFVLIRNYTNAQFSNRFKLHKFWALPINPQIENHTILNIIICQSSSSCPILLPLPV